jgi:hypothetical protein
MVSADGPLAATVYASDRHGGFSMLHLEVTPGIIVYARASRQTNYPIGAHVRFRRIVNRPSP